MGTAEYHHAQAPRGCRVVRVAVVVRARWGTHCVALRVYIGMLFCEVAASRCAKAPLGAAHRFAPCRVYKTHPMQSAFAGYGRTAVGAPRSHSRPTRRQLAPLWLSWHCGIGQALRAGFLSVACGQSCCVCPAHPVASPLRGIGPALGARPPPRGSLSPAPQFLDFATSLVAANARNTRATGLTACKPA